ncbi:hypothetical protein C1J01_34695 [Nonomuraea aridisoli]|uniref:Uncharacterized protein n=1 Tax=Nonomuraea aridisoli TaxID=2070368 RepID=A0A2W2DHW5_9ACTN|nr:hypothetical protein C1J01_34695 [Nonomuraea aridisoli]
MAQSLTQQVKPDESRVRERRRQIAHVAVGRVVEQHDLLPAGHFSQPLDHVGGLVRQDPVVGRQVDAPPGLLVGQRPARWMRTASMVPMDTDRNRRLVRREFRMTF